MTRWPTFNSGPYERFYFKVEAVFAEGSTECVVYVDARSPGKALGKIKRTISYFDIETSIGQVDGENPDMDFVWATHLKDWALGNRTSPAR